MELRWQVCRKQGPDLEDFGSSPDLPDVLQVGQGQSMSDMSPTRPQVDPSPGPKWDPGPELFTNKFVYHFMK